MKSVTELNFPETLQYTSEHLWIHKKGAELVAGITDFAQDQLGEISFIDLPQTGEHVVAGDSFGTVESIKSVNTLFMPVSGHIVAVNATLEDTPTLVNVSCYENGWLIRIRPDEPLVAVELLNRARYLDAASK